MSVKEKAQHEMSMVPILHQKSFELDDGQSISLIMSQYKDYHLEERRKQLSAKARKMSVDHAKPTVKQDSWSLLGSQKPNDNHLSAMACKSTGNYRKSAKDSSERSVSSRSSRSSKSKSIKKEHKLSNRSIGGCKQRAVPRKSQFVRNMNQHEQISDEEESGDEAESFS